MLASCTKYVGELHHDNPQVCPPLRNM